MTASLFIQKVGVVLSGTSSHVTVSDTEKLHALRVGVRVLVKERSTKAIADVASLIKNSNDNYHIHFL